MATLKVKPVGKAMVPDYEALEQGVLRFIGRRHDASIGHVMDQKTGKKAGGYVPTDDVVELPHRIEYIQELQAGTLEPADSETARLAGISLKK